MVCTVRGGPHGGKAALGHDLGHTPFGHLGEQALSPFLGRPFRHSEQSLRVVDHLERDGRGLNLTWEVRDGIVNHTWSMPMPATLEGQVVRFADRLGYVNHDIDDAIRAGLLTEADLPEEAVTVLGRDHGTRIDTLVRDIVETSGEAPEIGMSEPVVGALDVLREFITGAFQCPYRVCTTSEETLTGLLVLGLVVTGRAATIAEATEQLSDNPSKW